MEKRMPCKPGGSQVGAVVPMIQGPTSILSCLHSWRLEFQATRVCKTAEDKWVQPRGRPGGRWRREGGGSYVLIPGDTLAAADLTRYRPDLTRYRPDLTRYRPDLTRYRPDLTRYRPDLTRYRPDLTRYRPDTLQT
ncbi:unnamed protein product [Boreogadus saida]